MSTVSFNPLKVNHAGATYPVDHGVLADASRSSKRPPVPPFKIKVVESIKLTTQPEREEILRRAHFNLFNVRSEDVLIDLLTDSGTSAMSMQQWANMKSGDESYAGAASWYRFEATMRELTGIPNVLPTHQGRASERILFQLIGGQGKVIPGNHHFDTTRGNIENTGATAVDLLISEGHQPQSHHPFKGNLDPAKLLTKINEVGKENIPICIVTVTNNSGGGQPVSLGNLRQIRAICTEHGIPLFLDAARFAENAYFIQQREENQKHRSVREIAHEMFELADGALISAKKDGLVNIGGVLLIRDEQLAAQARNLLILTEGYVTYGGLAGRDLEAMAQGIDEVMDEAYLRHRVQSVEFLGNEIRKAGVQIVEPPGGHAIYIDAAHFCDHLTRDQFPGQALVCELYRQAGIRAVEVGRVMFEDATMELVRLAIPRRVYTQEHIEYVIASVSDIYRKRHHIRGLRIDEAPAALRHFTAKFVELEA